MSPAPARFTVSGAVTGAAGVEVVLLGSTTSALVSAAVDGTFAFTGIPNGTYTVTPAAAGHALSPVQRQVVVDGASVTGLGFVGTALTTFDPLDAGTLDGARWQTPEYVRTISGGKASLSVRANGMQSNGVQGLSYTNALTVEAGDARVTTLRAEVTAPAAGVVRTGSATVFGGLRLYYQPAANRNLSAPGAFLNELIAAVELYDGGGGLRVRRRFAHCDDDACINLGGSGVAYVDPVGFTTSGGGVNAVAPATYDTPYTFTIALNEVTGVFTWTVQGGTFGATGVSGTAAVATWASTVGLNLASTTSGFLSAQLHARTSDASPAGGGSGAFTATFDDVMIGTNGAAATPFDDFSTDLDAARWGPDARGTVQARGGALHLRAGTTTARAGASSAATTLAAMYPSTFGAWQADVAVLDAAGVASLSAVQVGGAFLNDGTAGAAHDATGDVVSRVVLRLDGASAWVGRCEDATCSTLSTIATRPLPVNPARPLGAGTVHTVFQQWDAATRALAYRLDAGTSTVVIPLPVANPAAPRVPSRSVRAAVSFPAGTPPGTSASLDATVANVRTAP